MSTQQLRQAIVHDVISRLQDVRKIQLQKIVYFLQESEGVPTRYTFRMHHYGPYAEALETDTSRLRFAGYVDIEPDSQGYGFHISATDDPEDAWRDLTRAHQESIDHILSTFGNRPISELELAATIHFINKLRPDESTEEVLAKVKALKPKFDGAYIFKIYTDLKQLGLFS